MWGSGLRVRGSGVVSRAQGSDFGFVGFQIGGFRCGVGGCFCVPGSCVVRQTWASPVKKVVVVASYGSQCLKKLRRKEVVKE